MRGRLDAGKRDVQSLRVKATSWVEGRGNGGGGEGSFFFFCRGPASPHDSPS